MSHYVLTQIKHGKINYMTLRFYKVARNSYRAVDVQTTHSNQDPTQSVPNQNQNDVFGQNSSIKMSQSLLILLIPGNAY